MSVPHLAELMRGRATVVLSGAGISTESGIPDYRGPQGSLRGRTPMTYRQYVGSADNRRRYWARSASGWKRVSEARPNPAHLALARMEERGQVTGLITQNVDGLHSAAGSRRVIELHGALASVRCMDCGAQEDRDNLQHRLEALNPAWDFEALEAGPDGDAELSTDREALFSVPACRACGGTLRPDVIFFGENVPGARVQAAARMVDEAGLLLVAGSSLAVYSGFRFVQQAAAKGIPVAIVNLGPTRGDAMARIRIEDRLGVVLPQLASALGAADGRPGEPLHGGPPDRGPTSLQGQESTLPEA